MLTRLVVLRLTEKEFESLKMLVDEGFNAMHDDPLFSKAVGEQQAAKLKGKLEHESRAGKSLRGL